MKNNKLLSVAIMVKDEEERIIRTLETVINNVDQVVILDTGSTDRTVEVIKEYCKEKNKPLKIKIEPFVDFSYNRNILLNMCFGLSEFILLLDANDEVKNIKTLVKFLNSVKSKKKECVFKCRYIWENDLVRNNNTIYYKIGIIRNNVEDIYYEFPIHEYITSAVPGKYISNETLTNTDFYIYQDRSKDKSSIPRIKKDVDVLKNYLLIYGDNSRAYRYLCQSLNVLEDYKELNLYAGKLVEFIENTDKKEGKNKLNTTFNDDYYYGLMSKAIGLYKTGGNNFNLYFLKAYKYCKIVFENAHPFYEMAKSYFEKNEIDTAYLYIKKCCEINLPKNIQQTFINYEIYNLHRWKLLYDIGIKKGSKEDVKYSIEKLKGKLELNDPFEENRLDINNIPDNIKDIVKEHQTNNTLDMTKLNPAQRETIEKFLMENKTNMTNNKKIKSQEELKNQTIGYKLYLFVPYRDRQEQLDKFIPHMHKLLTYLGMEFEIVIIEQDDKSLFHRGMLFNVAFKYIKNPEKSYICLHDVDVIPIKATNYYKPDDRKVTLLYGYTRLIGTVCLFNCKDYMSINGMSNLFKGWGYEDTDMYRRTQLGGLEIDYSYYYPRYNKECFIEFDHDETAAPAKMHLPQTLKNKAIYEAKVDYKLDGLDRIENIEKYTSIENKELYTLFRVNIEKIYDDLDLDSVKKRYNL